MGATRIARSAGASVAVLDDLVSEQPLLAPVSAGQRVGTIKVSLDGKPVGEYPVVALESVGVAGIFGRTWDSMRLWLK